MNIDIAILGGMGPQAGANYFKILTDLFSTEKGDQEHPEVLLYSNSKIPDRAKSVDRNDDAPYQMLRESLEYLNSLNSNIINIACNSIHHWIYKYGLQNEFSSILTIDKATAQFLETTNEKQEFILLGTTATTNTSFYFESFKKHGLKLSKPSDNFPILENVISNDYIDNIDPFLISEKLEELSEKLSTTLFVVVSKSGGTPEPRIAMEIIKSHCENNSLEWNSNAIAITMKDSKLFKKATSENWLKIFNLQDWVGGRTSITSSVGLLPLALINENIFEFIRGASLMDEATRISDFKNNPAALLSSAWYLTGDGVGKRDMVVLPYRDRLQVFSKYLQQLVMESLGKKFNRNGEVVNQGISVFGNKGSTDQHAYVQQLRDGIDNFFCIFIELLDSPSTDIFDEKENPKEYLSGFLQGTRSALSSENRQSITITLEKLNCFSLGALIALFERAVSFYAELVNINAYDQPGVEAGKKAAANIIEYQQKVSNLLDEGGEYSINDITSLFDNSVSEPIFFILREMCFGNDNYLIKGDWSNPNSLVIQKINS